MERRSHHGLDLRGISADSNYPGCRHPSFEGSLTKASVGGYGSDRDHSRVSDCRELWAACCTSHRPGRANCREVALRRANQTASARPMLVPSLVVGILLAVISMLPNLSVFHPNRQLAHHEAERISESPDRAKLAEKLGRFVDERPLTLTSLTVSYLNAAIRGELISRLFLLSIVALIFAKITGSPSGTASNRVLFSAALGVAAIGVIASVAWQGATTKMIYSSVGMIKIVHDSFWLVIARALLRTIPGAVGFGWLYVRRGIESAILSAFVSSVVAHLLFVLVAVRLF